MRGNPTTWGKTPASIQKIQSYLDSLPYKELVRIRSVAEHFGVTLNTVRQDTKHPALADYRQDLKYNDVVWGSRKTIKELRRRFNDK